MKTSFKRFWGRDIPKRGDLIRSGYTGQYINLVHTTEPTANGLLVTSVRYANTNGGKVRLLNGKRARRFFWHHRWKIVSEVTVITRMIEKVVRYEAVQNQQLLEALLLQPVEFYKQAQEGN